MASRRQARRVLRSARPAAAGCVTLATQCSIDRLDRLHAQCRAWDVGTVCAAVFCDPARWRAVSGRATPGGAEAPDAALREAAEAAVGRLHADVEATGKCRLDVVLVHASDVAAAGECVPVASSDVGAAHSDCSASGSPSPGTTAPLAGAAPSPSPFQHSSFAYYPINALRNIAMSLCKTDLVLMLDVDLIPCEGMARACADADAYRRLWLSCAEARCAVVVPAFEISALEGASKPRGSARGDDAGCAVSSGAAEGGASIRARAAPLPPPLPPLETPAPTAAMVAACDKAALKELHSRGAVRQFCAIEYPVGHGATAYERWFGGCAAAGGADGGADGGTDGARASLLYDVEYAEGYEPYVVLYRPFVPAYDERFSGYGKNKVAHLLHLAALGFRFSVLRGLFVVHAPHAPSPDRRATLGDQSGLASYRSTSPTDVDVGVGGGATRGTGLHDGDGDSGARAPAASGALASGASTRPRLEHVKALFEQVKREIAASGQLYYGAASAQGELGTPTARGAQSMPLGWWRSEADVPPQDAFDVAAADSAADALLDRTAGGGATRARHAMRSCLPCMSTVRGQRASHVGDSGRATSTAGQAAGGAVVPPHSLMSQTVLRTWFELRFAYEQEPLAVVGNTLRSALPRRPTDVTIIVTASVDRLQRLEDMASSWCGVISAAVLLPDPITVRGSELASLPAAEQDPVVDESRLGRRNRRWVKSLHELQARVESTDRTDGCRLELTRVVRLRLAGHHRSRRRGPRLFPINSLRCTALAAAQTDLVFVVDVDLRPCVGLARMLGKPGAYEALRARCCGSPSAVPGESSAAERGIMQEEGDRLREREGRAGPHDHGRLLNHGETAVVVPAFEFVAPRSPETIARCLEEDARWAAGELDRGVLRGFHVDHYPAGHSPTDLATWSRHAEPEATSPSTPLPGPAGDTVDRPAGGAGSADTGRRPLTPAPAARAGGVVTYGVTFRPGFEPFVIVARAVALAGGVGTPELGSFDRRFRGYGYDKVSWCYALAARGCRFEVLTQAFLLDTPHARTADRDVSFGPARVVGHRLCLDALYELFKRQVDCNVSELLREAGGGATVPTVVGDSGIPASAPTAVEGRAGLVLACHEQFATDAWRAGWRVTVDDGLHNVSIIRDGAPSVASLPAAPSRERSGDVDALDANTFMRIAIPAGTWAPAQTEAAGLAVGGVHLRMSAVPARGEKRPPLRLGGESTRRTMLVYRVRFARSFQWGKGGRMTGLYKKNVLETTFRWRAGGRGEFRCEWRGGAPAGGSVPAAAAGSRESVDDTRTRCVTEAARPFVFSVCTWHTLQQELLLEDGWIRVRAWADQQLVYERAGEAPEAFTSATPWPADGVRLAAFYGGSSSDWACPLTTCIDIADLRVLVDDGRPAAAERSMTAPRSLGDPRALRPRLLFVISPGRCGTQYLTNLVATVDGVRATHEPEPNMAGSIGLAVQARGLEATREMRMFKVDAIRAQLEGLAAGDTYAETNHMFIKTFCDLVVAVLAPQHHVTVVVLRRYIPAMMRSRAALGHLRVDEASGDAPRHSWVWTTNAVGAALPPLAPDAEQSQLDLLMGYMVDVEARAQRFIDKYGGSIRVVEARLEELNEVLRVRRLLSHLGLKPTAATDAAVGKVANARSAEKEAKGLRPVSLAECEDCAAAWIARCRKAGIHLPRLPHMTPWSA